MKSTSCVGRFVAAGCLAAGAILAPVAGEWFNAYGPNWLACGQGLPMAAGTACVICGLAALATFVTALDEM